MVGYRETNLVNWGCFDDPDYVDYSYANMTEWGRKRYITPGIAISGELITTDLVEINLAIRILLGSSYFDGWENEPTFVTQDPLGNPVDKNHPWNKVTLPKPQKRDFADKYTWVVSPRIYDKRTDTHVCCDTGGGPFARQWCTAKAGLVDFGYAKATGAQHPDGAAALGELPRDGDGVEGAGEVQRDRARSRAHLPPGLLGPDRAAQPGAGDEGGAGRAGPRAGTTSRCPSSAVSCGFHEAARGVLSHHMVIANGKIANYQPYPPTPWNASPRDVYGTPGPYEDAVQNTPIFEENGPENFKGDRHHAGGPLVRPVPAVRRAHVRGQGAGAEGRPHARRRSPRGRWRAAQRSSIARVQELTAAARGRSTTRPCRELAEELTAAVVQMYGAGPGADRRADRRRGRRRETELADGRARRRACC